MYLKISNAMKLYRLFLSLLILFLYTEVRAQSQLTIKNNWMFTDVTISNAGSANKVSGMIDTGASVSLIDSTFAVDSCQVKDLKGDRTMGNGSGKYIKSSSIYLDSISIGGVVYTEVWCFVVDLAGKLQQYAPKFIIGGDILKKDIWSFDLKENQLKRCFSVPDNVAVTLHWKKFADAALNYIYFKGKVGGRKTRILFDTGSRRGDVPCSSELIPTSIIKVPRGNIAEALTYKEEGLCKDIPVEISDYSFKVDFIKPNECGAKYPVINADFLQGKKWVLDYKHRRLLILYSD